jgi:hypothetical protein
MMNNTANSSGGFPIIGGLTRPVSSPVQGFSNANNPNTNPQVIYKPNNQEVVYKQNIMVRWLQPPTPPPPAPIIIRGKFLHLLNRNEFLLSNRSSSSDTNSTTYRLPTSASLSTNTTTNYRKVKKNNVLSSSRKNVHYL